MPLYKNTNTYENKITWSYFPTDHVNFNRYNLAETTHLIITSHIHISLYILQPLVIQRVPRLDLFNFGNLRRLELYQLNVMDMTTRIPDSVRVLTLLETNVTDLTKINVNWSNIYKLILKNNIKLKGKYLNIPEGVEYLKLEEQICDTIRLPSTNIRLILQYVTINHITGYLPKLRIDVDYSSYLPNYNTSKIINFDLDRDDEIDESFGNEGEIRSKYHLMKINYIKSVNKQTNYQTYIDFGSIPYRIKNAYEHRENPIIVALHLASNIPRRMAEFVTDNTIVD